MRFSGQIDFEAYIRILIPFLMQIKAATNSRSRSKLGDLAALLPKTVYAEITLKQAQARRLLP
jgi:hypothetical protein